ncbi:MAG TPA: pili assembly chaperone [Candidatus Dormibacteraeota bacterium]|nr:pili assembly chaperone [Candidatus Dormibacteraeota bacterium]
MAANQSGAAGTVRTINTGEATFSTVCAQVGYSMALADLNTGGGCTAGAGIIDTVLAGGTKSGYTFTEAGGAAVGGVNTTFTARAAPVTLGSSGQNMYCSDQLGVIRFDPSGKGCTNASLPIGN